MSEENDLIQDDAQVNVLANPERYPFLKGLDLDQDVQRRLSLHLDRIRVGDSSVFVSPLGKDNNPGTILDSWNSVFESNSNKMNEVLVKLELSNKAKFGPRSIAKPWSQRVSSVKDYYTIKPKLPFDIYSGIKDSGKGKLRPISVDSALKILKNNTNSGMPYYARKGKVKDRTSRKLDYLLSRRDPCVLFTRTQEGDKTRNVWGYPCADTLEEMRYYRPLLSVQERLSWRSALVGPDYVSKSITELILKATEGGYRILSGDISSFDANVSTELSDAAFHYIKRLFQQDFRSGLDRVCERFKSIGLITPSGIFEGYHGVPSGSTFTNEVDSIVQYLILRSLSIKDDSFQIQGDDLALMLRDADFEMVKQRYEACSLPFNLDKSYVSSDHCIYLQNLYHLDYLRNGIIGGIYPTYRALNRIIYQERWSDFEDFDLEGKDYYSIRTISILENCKHHPLFRELVEFIFKMDKYSLEFSHKAVSKYERMVDNSSGSEGFMNNQYSDNVRGINGFETVKLIRSFRK